MRTTLSLDDDVAAMLNRLQKSSESSFKELVNTALREGLGRMNQPSAKNKTFKTSAVSLGQCKFPNLDDIAEVLAFGEGENFR
jgi:hypothetical protein